MNKNFAEGQSVICTLGSNKGKRFKIALVLKNGYSCKLEGTTEDRYYRHTDNTLEAAQN